MKKSEELLRMERDLNEQPELKEKLEAECKRTAEAGEAQCDGDVMVQAAAALGYTITLGELERFSAEMEELDPEELDVAGGAYEDYHDDEYGHEEHCIAVWHCYTAMLHTESEKKIVACWNHYGCCLAFEEIHPPFTI